jgi:hypothetical protein
MKALALLILSLALTGGIWSLIVLYLEVGYRVRIWWRRLANWRVHIQVSRDVREQTQKLNAGLSHSRR